ncbi:MAG: InlB B-repeat-containing protein [Clostridia bacterium]|nr:InlB B-repeat-containing protein [Clostridia bacterium]
MTKRLISAVMAIAMFLSLIPETIIPAFAAGTAPVADGGSEIVQNSNQQDGVVLSKYAVPHTEGGEPDGTVDIYVEAHTTGKVVTTATQTPTDIVLVLDLSGSMNETQSSTQVTGYDPVYAEETSIKLPFTNTTLYYHVGVDDSAVYVKLSDDSYVRANGAGNDSNGFEMFSYVEGGTSHTVYPALSGGATTERARSNSYPVVQMYRQTTTTVVGETKIKLLKDAVDQFIKNTETANSTVANASDKHRIALVKFGTADYYNDNNLIAEGNHKNGSNYNYTEVVKGFTTVDAAGASTLQTAMDSLTSGGATAVDYGINLAIKLFEAQDEALEAHRNKVVVVFTDGSPTHSDGYSTTVAGAAINYAKTLKDEGITVYSLSVADGADGTQLGSTDANKFMHYVSSNYPEASYNTSSGVITAGTGTPSNGYYLTTDNSNSLSMLFESIADEIGTPTISLGEEAVLVDTVSEYFTVTGGINGVKVMTSVKNADGTWGEMTVDSSLTPVVSGNSVWVQGFDFDQHYISEQPRMVGAAEYYGKSLILCINATPDYSVIDEAGDSFATASGAYIDTNYGSAQLSTGTSVVAEVESPKLPINTVTYKVDGADYETNYRLAGSVSALVSAPSKTGADFSGWTSSDVTITAGSFEMPRKNVVINGSFTDIDYTVSYQYVGAEIAGRPALPSDDTKNYGDTVTVAAVPTLAGYDFVGWYPQDEALGTSALTSFTMPAHNVVLLGRFVVRNDVAYKVEHYTENLDGSWNKEDTEDLSGTTGAAVYAVAREYTGFTYDGSVAGTVAEGVIAGDGSLILKLYYTRNSYQVTYEYVNGVPADALPTAATLLTYTATHKYGETVTVKADATAAGYIFNGWYSAGGTVQNDDLTFTMPAQNVALRGYFTARADTIYTVEHYFENLDGTDFVLDSAKTETFHALTDSDVSAKALNVQGFTFDSANTNNVVSGTVKGDGSLTLKLYYTRNSYKVYYDYTGTIPSTADPADPVLGTWTAEYKFGAQVTVKAAATATNHEFHGWHYANDTTHTIVTGFTMPANDVYLNGHFTRTSDPGYTVEHYFEKLDGTYPNAPDKTQDLKAAHGEPVTAVRLHETGFELDPLAADTVESGTVLDGYPLTLKLYYKRIEYNVTYVYSGTVPAGASPTELELASAPYTVKVKFGTDVNVQAKATAPSGYAFHGWASDGGTVTASTVTFTMPAQDVTIRGYFTKDTDTKYKVEHYFENINDSDFTRDDSRTENLTGVTDTKAYANALTVPGFTFDSTNTNNKLEGNIEGDDSLVLKVYYKRNVYKVYYAYTGTIPSTVNPTESQLASYTTEYKFGAQVTAKGTAAADNHEFHGWHYANDTSHAIVTTFTMPANDVYLTGHFIRTTDPGYTVKHYFEKLDGTYPATPDKTQELKAADGELVTAIRLHETGFTLDTTAAGTKLSDVVEDGKTVVLELYYTRNSYKVIYEYEGTVPSVTNPTETQLESAPYTAEYKFGAPVTVQPAASAQGYTFHGWYRNNDGTHTVVAGTFEMPAQNIQLFGEFSANTDTKYTVEHYFENTAGDYVVDISKTQTLYDGVTGANATAHPISVSGYVYNSAMSAATRSGTVKADGSLTLKLYYERVAYTVTYSYSAAPAGTAVPTPDTDVAHGTVVTVKPAPAVAGYTFSGWTFNGVPVGATFTMPEANVTLVGSYTVNGYSYKVEHYVETDLGYELHGTADIRQANYGTDVTASAIDIHGYIYNANKTETENGGKSFTDAAKTVLKTKIVDGTIVFAFYYDRQEYTVTYVINGAVVPQGAAAPASETVKFGSTVNVHGGFSIPGYTFSGWTTTDVSYTGTSFSMPANDVTFTGSFATGTVGYTVKYWQETLDGSGTKDWNSKNYAEVTADRVSGTGVTGHYVNAYTSHYIEYTGFLLSVDNNEFEGSIKGDGSLVLNLYYNRLTFNVTYTYAGVQPDDAPAIPASYNLTNVPYGAVVTVADKMADYSNRKFDGWHGANIDIVGKTTFTMPAYNVSIYGTYVPVNPQDFTVTYYVDGLVYHSETVKPGQVHDIIDAPQRAGFVFSGWSSPVNVETQQTVTANGVFVMPWADVEIRGTFTSTYRPTQLLLDKRVTAPDGFDLSREYVFEIYSIDDLTTPVATTTTYAGATAIVQLEPGTYKLVEKNPHIDGYKHDYTCSHQDGIFVIYAQQSTRVTCTNVYTAVELERGDHFGYIVGYPDGTVQPEANITRAEAATIFFRMLTDDSRKQVWSDTNDYTDVNAEDWFNVAVSTLRNAEILLGDETEFRPNDPITRAELVAIATAFYDSEVGDECAFSDIRGHWAEKFITEAYNLGLIEGYPDGTFRPDDTITRAEAIAVVNRTLERHPDAEHFVSGMIEWPDNMDTSKWYYAHIQEATNSHTYRIENGVEVWIDIRPIRDWAALEDKWREENEDEE